jgi:hypothetical protein
MLEPILLYPDQAINGLIKGPRLAKTSLWRKRSKPIDNIGDGFDPSISISAIKERLNLELVKIQSSTTPTHNK